jgi:hypothetical protein
MESENRRVVRNLVMIEPQSYSFDNESLEPFFHLLNHRGFVSFPGDLEIRFVGEWVI